MLNVGFFTRTSTGRERVKSLRMPPMSPPERCGSGTRLIAWIPNDTGLIAARFYDTCCCSMSSIAMGSISHSVPFPKYSALHCFLVLRQSGTPHPE